MRNKIVDWFLKHIAEERGVHKVLLKCHRSIVPWSITFYFTDGSETTHRIPSEEAARFATWWDDLRQIGKATFSRRTSKDVYVVRAKSLNARRGVKKSQD